MKEQTAQNLSDTLTELEACREDLENAPTGQKAAAAEKYMEARERSGPIFAQAQGEYDLTKAGASRPGAEPPAPSADAADPPQTEAAPGVPLVAPPAVVIDVTNLERYGPLVQYWSKENPDAEPVEATPYCFAEGTAVTTEDGNLAVGQPSRIVKGEKTLAIVTQDEFDKAFTDEDPNAKKEGEDEAAEKPINAGEQAAPADPPAAGDAAAQPEA